MFSSPGPGPDVGLVVVSKQLGVSCYSISVSILFIQSPILLSYIILIVTE